MTFLCTKCHQQTPVIYYYEKERLCKRDWNKQLQEESQQKHLERAVMRTQVGITSK